MATVEPFLGFLEGNLDVPHLELGILMQLAGVALVIVAALYLFLLFSLPAAPPARVAAGLAAFVFCFFRYGLLDPGSNRSTLVTLGFWVVVTFLVVTLVAMWSRSEGVRFFLVLFLAISAVIPTVSIVTSWDGTQSDTATAKPKEALTVTDAALRPDVWWLMLDQYGRADALDVFQGYDNGPFLDDLEERGFSVSDESYTSYPTTPLSVSSVLDLDYVLTEANSDEAFTSYTDAMRTGGRVVEALREHGYRYLFADNGFFNWGACNADVVDVCVPSAPTQWSVGRMSRTVSLMTPLAELFGMGRPDVEWTVDRTQQMLDPDAPNFVFAHILSPHDPYWFDRDCNRRSKAIGVEYDAENYVQELACLNPRVLAAVDGIIAEDPDAIIIVQSDHGAAPTDLLALRYEDWSAEELSDRYAILEAMRFPERCATPTGSHSNVSTFEYVLACIEGRPPEPLEDRYFFWSWGFPRDVVEIDRPPAPGDT